MINPKSPQNCREFPLPIRQRLHAETVSGQQIVIVGAGASGALMAAHLLRPGRPAVSTSRSVEPAPRSAAASPTRPESEPPPQRARSQYERFRRRSRSFRALAGGRRMRRTPTAIPISASCREASMGAISRAWCANISAPGATRGLTRRAGRAAPARRDPDGVEIALAAGPPLRADLAVSRLRP